MEPAHRFHSRRYPRCMIITYCRNSWPIQHCVAFAGPFHHPMMLQPPQARVANPLASRRRRHVVLHRRDIPERTTANRTSACKSKLSDTRRLITGVRWISVGRTANLSAVHEPSTCTRSFATAEIARVDGCYAVQGHSRSLMLAPIESPYATSC